MGKRRLLFRRGYDIMYVQRGRRSARTDRDLKEEKTMTAKKRKILFTIIDMIVVLIAGYWVLWLTVYFVQTIDGAILITSNANIFERNYLVPAQIFGITIAFTIATILLYRKLRKKHLIGKKYILLALFNTLPFWLISVSQVNAMVYYWDWIY